MWSQEEEDMEVVVRYDRGSRFTAECHDHTVVTGKAGEEPGPGDGMWPAQMFAASLGMCIGGYVVSYCHRRGIPCDGMRIELERESVKVPSRAAKVAVKIHMPEPLPEEEKKRVLRVADTCYITQSIVHGMKVEVSLSEPVPGSERSTAPGRGC